MLPPMQDTQIDHSELRPEFVPGPPERPAWPAIAKGDHSLILAPTGSGKTLSAFLWAIDRLTSTPPPEERTHRTRVLYISPLRALAVDVEKNLRAPIQGIRLAADRLGVPYTEPTVGLRSGDTPSDERRPGASSRRSFPLAGRQGGWIGDEDERAAGFPRLDSATL